MIERRPTGSPFLRRLTFSLVILCLFVPVLSYGQVMVKVNDNVNFKFGTLIQAWADSQQDATSQGYAESMFLRRMRFLVAGQISPNISFFFETDNPNLGRNKNTSGLGTGFITQDAFIEWKPTGSQAFMIDGGLMLPPVCRNCLESAGTLLSLDYGSNSFNESGVTQSSVGRDTGFLAKGYLMGGKLEYRAGLFDGFRAANLRNPLRGTARLQYEFWDTEPGYVYPGMYLGNKRVLSVGAAVDHQAHYNGYSVDGFLSMPVTPAKDAINAEIDILRYNGGTTFTGLPVQNDALVQAGYYLAGPKIMPFARYERQDFRTAANDPKDNHRLQAGVTWYPNGNNFNLKGAYSRVNPRVGNKTNEFTVQMQFFYF